MKNDMQFTGKNGEFQIRHMVEKTQLNFPVANEEGIKSSVTQTFGGDCKLDQNHFLLEPVSIENLHNNRSTRNVWCTINRKEHVSLTRSFGAGRICTFPWKRGGSDIRCRIYVAGDEAGIKRTENRGSRADLCSAWSTGRTDAGARYQ